MATPATPVGIVVTNNLSSNNNRLFPSVTVSWDANTEVDIGSYRIYRNFVPYGTFQLVSTVSHPTVSYTDEPKIETVEILGGKGIAQGLEGFWYYRVSAVSTANEESPASPPFTYIDYNAFANDPFGTQTVGLTDVGYLPDIDAEMPCNEDLQEYFEIIRARALWILQQDGQEVLLYKRRVEGIKCPFWDDDSDQCKDPLGEPRFTANNTCFNTGIVGGYHSPIKVKMRIVPANAAVNLKQSGYRADHLPDAWTIWTPRLANLDFFIDNRGQRYEISQVNDKIWRGGLITRQEFNTVRKWATDYLYYVPVPSGTILP
jgi:hypothetical protein